MSSRPGGCSEVIEHRIGQPAFEFGIVAVPPEELSIALHQTDDHARQRDLGRPVASS